MAVNSPALGHNPIDSGARVCYYVDAVRHGAAERAPGILGTIGLAERVLVPPLTLGRSISGRQMTTETDN